MTSSTKKILICIIVITILGILFYAGTHVAQAPADLEQNVATDTPVPLVAPPAESTLGTNEYRVLAIVNDPKAVYANVTLSTSPRIFKLLKNNPSYTKYLSMLETAKTNKSIVYISPSNETPDTIDSVTHVPDQVTFVGAIESYDTGCFADATCSVTVSGKKVVLVTGGRRVQTEPVGQLLGTPSIGDLEINIGRTAKVYAKMIDGKNYTIYGNEDYFVSVQ
jgi:hypothetical protein